MSKATYIGVNDGLGNIQARKVKNVWIKENGVLKQKVVPKGLVGGSIREFMNYITMLYEDGIQLVGFEKGYNLGYSRKFNLDAGGYMLLGASDPTSANIAVMTSRTTNPIDISNYNRLYVEWANIGAISSNNKSSLIGGQGSPLLFTDTTADFIFQRSSMFERAIDYVDISQFSGDFYLGVCASERRTTSSVVSEILVYKIWLE